MTLDEKVIFLEHQVKLLNKSDDLIWEYIKNIDKRIKLLGERIDTLDEQVSYHELYISELREEK